MFGKFNRFYNDNIRAYKILNNPTLDPTGWDEVDVGTLDANAHFFKVEVDLK